jgi:predicted enzyme related to lactoylglutathione lyase
MAKSQTKRTSGEYTEGQVRFTAINTADAAAFKKFAERAFGWNFLATLPAPDGDFYLFETPGGARGGVGQAGQVVPVGTIPYIHTTDIRATERAIRKAGGEILLPATEIPGQGWQMQFRYEGSPAIACFQDAL